MTADFGNFVVKNDEKRKTKDEMNPADLTKNLQSQFGAITKQHNFKDGLTDFRIRGTTEKIRTFLF